MQDPRSEQIVEIRDQIVLLELDKKRLLALIRSKFTSERYKVRAQADFKSALEKLKKLREKFARLVAEQ